MWITKLTIAKPNNKENTKKQKTIIVQKREGDGTQPMLL